ncbi:hypothetical protein [Pararhizobium gei]|nr:hypothetical protein [Rhizobium gei]
MAITMMLVSAAISIVFLVDFAKTIMELKRDQVAMKKSNRHSDGFKV